MSENNWPAYVLDSYPEAVAVIGADNQIVYANRAGRLYLQEVGIYELPAQASPSTLTVVQSVRRDGRPRHNVELRGSSGSWNGRAWPLDGAVVVALHRAPSTWDRVDAVGKSLGLDLRQAQLALHATDGMSNQAIADMYNLPIGTIATRLWRLYRKLGVRNRAELAAAVANALGESSVRPPNSRPATVQEELT